MPRTKNNTLYVKVQLLSTNNNLNWSINKHDFINMFKNSILSLYIVYFHTSNDINQEWNKWLISIVLSKYIYSYQQCFAFLLLKMLWNYIHIIPKRYHQFIRWILQVFRSELQQILVTNPSDWKKVILFLVRPKYFIPKLCHKGAICWKEKELSWPTDELIFSNT